jgi:2-oxo-4-hydroxy-4-carboxy--5-ureidoimidazoline (OHCU) decarboxylase
MEGRRGFGSPSALGAPPTGLATHRRAAALRAFAEPVVAQAHAAAETQHSTAWLAAASRHEFADAVSHCYETAPWVAERGHDSKPAGKPFASLADIEGALWGAVNSASDEEQLMLLNAYPDAVDAYPEERYGSLTTAEMQRFTAKTAEYKARFGFPFILANRNATKRSALRAIEAPVDSARGSSRLHNDPSSERRAALAQVRKMAWMRLRMTVLLERVFATWRDYSRLREVYTTSKVLRDDVRIRMLKMERGMLFARYRQSERYPDICEMSVTTALRSTARAFLAWRQLLQLLSLYREAARREVGADSNARKMLLDLGSDTPRMLRKYPVEELLFRARVKYSPSEELVKQKHPHQRWKAPPAKPAGAPEKRWVSDTKLDPPAEPERALPRKSGVIPEDTGKRLHAHQMKYAEELQRKRERRRLEEQQREDAELTGRPAICSLPWASSSDRKREDETIADSLLRRKQEKDDRMLQKQERAARRRQKMADAGTHMSTGTRNITDRLDRGMPIEDMLLAQGELSKQRRNYLRHLKEQEDRVSIEMGPSITHAADVLHRQGDVCERCGQNIHAIRLYFSYVID